MINAETFYVNNFQKASRLNVSRGIMDKVAQDIKGKEFDVIVGKILASTPKMQFVVLASMYCLAVEGTQQPADFDPADGIIWKLGEGLAKYGDKTYGLSEAQIKLVVGKVRHGIK